MVVAVIDEGIGILLVVEVSVALAVVAVLMVIMVDIRVPPVVAEVGLVIPPFVAD
jgi:hypothetical protein